jgi:hypothetical protein
MAFGLDPRNHPSEGGMEVSGCGGSEAIADRVLKIVRMRSHSRPLGDWPVVQSQGLVLGRLGGRPGIFLSLLYFDSRD